MSEVQASELNATAHSGEAADTAITETDLIEQLRRTGAHAQPLPFSEDALAHRFLQEHGEQLRYVPDWDRWMRWDGVRWKRDSRQRALNNARIVCRGASRTCNEPKLARSLASARTAAAVIQLAKADPRISTTVDVWDQDPWLLNTPAGTINLRTGIMHPCERRDYITKVTAVALKGECPRHSNEVQTARGAQPQSHVKSSAPVGLHRSDQPFCKRIHTGARTPPSLTSQGGVNPGEQGRVFPGR